MSLATTVQPVVWQQAEERKRHKRVEQTEVKHNRKKRAALNLIQRQGCLLFCRQQQQKKGLR